MVVAYVSMFFKFLGIVLIVKFQIYLVSPEPERPPQYMQS